MKKNKKRKPLGSIQFKVILRAMTKEEMNEVAEYYFSNFFCLFWGIIYTSDLCCAFASNFFR